MPAWGVTAGLVVEVGVSDTLVLMRLSQRSKCPLASLLLLRVVFDFSSVFDSASSSSSSSPPLLKLLAVLVDELIGGGKLVVLEEDSTSPVVRKVELLLLDVVASEPIKLATISCILLAVVVLSEPVISCTGSLLLLLVVDCIVINDSPAPPT